MGRRRREAGKAAAVAAAEVPAAFPYGIAATVFLLPLVAFLPGFWGSFLPGDDVDAVLNNPVLRSLDGLVRLWFNPLSVADAESHYWPLTYTSFWLEAHLWGLHAGSLIAVNVLLHAANTVLFWRILRVLEVPGAVIAAALFAVHPTRVESVAWVIERKDVLCGFFALAGLLTHLMAGEGRRWLRVAAVFLFAASLLCKSASIGLPVVIAMIGWWRGKSPSAVFREALPFAVVGVLITAFDLWLLSQVDAYDSGAGLGGRALRAAENFGFYGVNLLIPLRLAWIYPPSFGLLWQVLQWVFVLGFATLVAIGWRQRAVMVGLGVFVVGVLPVLGLVDFGYLRIAPVADRYTYLAAGGLFALIGAALSRPKLLPIAATLVVLCGGLTFTRARLFTQPEALLRESLTANPDSWFANSLLGSLLVEQNRLDDARPLLERSLRAAPTNIVAQQNLAVIYLRQQRTAEALAILEQLRRAKLTPLQEASVLQNFANAAFLVGRLQEGRYAMARAVALNPASASARIQFAYMLMQLGEREKAREEAKAGLRLAPGDATGEAIRDRLK